MVRSSTRNGQRIRICLVSSIGGHLAELRCLRGVYEQYECVYILNAPTTIHEDMFGKTFWMSHSERDWKFLLNLYEAWHLLRALRPTVIFSAGAGCIVPIALVALCYRIPVIYLESMTNVETPSLTGRIMYHLADKFLVQWEDLLKTFPNAIYAGGVR